MRNNLAYDSINEVVQNGIELSRSNYNSFSEEQFKIWFDYSTRVLDMLSGTVYGRTPRYIEPSIQINYLRLSIQLMNPNIPAIQKLIACLDYLIEVLKYIK